MSAPAVPADVSAAAVAIDREEPHKSPWVFRVLAVIAFVYMLTPVAIVVTASLNSGDYLTFPPQGLSLKWIRSFLTSDIFVPAYLYSMKLAFLAMVISTVLGTLASVFLTRARFSGRGPLRAFFLAPLLVPGLVLGLALYVFYLNNAWLHMSRNFAGMLMGHVLVTLPFVIGTVSAAMYGFDVSLEQAARSLGASPFHAFRTVTLPNIKSGISAGSLFAFIVSFGQFDLSLLLSTPNNTPLPFAMYSSLRYQFEPTSAAAGTFAIALVILSMIITSRLTDLTKFGGVKLG